MMVGQMTACSSALSTCLETKGYSNLCECEGDLVECYSGLGCGDAVMNSIEKACESAHCSATQCHASRRRLSELTALAMPSL